MIQVRFLKCDGTLDGSILNYLKGPIGSKGLQNAKKHNLVTMGSFNLPELI